MHFFTWRCQDALQNILSPNVALTVGRRQGGRWRQTDWWTSHWKAKKETIVSIVNFKANNLTKWRMGELLNLSHACTLTHYLTVSFQQASSQKGERFVAASLPRSPGADYQNTPNSCRPSPNRPSGGWGGRHRSPQRHQKHMPFIWDKESEPSKPLDR